MVKSRFGYRTPIPTISSQKAQTKEISFKDGVNSFKDNDDVKPTELVYASDARFSRIGRYRTRKGLDRYSVPIGEAVRLDQSQTTGASSYTINGTQSIAQQMISGTSTRVTRIDIKVATTSTSKGVLVVGLYSDNAGQPGTLLGQGSIAPSAVTGTPAFVPSYVVTAPLIASGQTYWVVVKGQNSNVGNYLISTTTAANGALIASGGIWNTTTYAANVQIYTAIDTPVTGLTRVYRPNGTKLTMFSYGTTVASVNDATGATTALKTDFVAGSSSYRFKMVQDAVYCVNGLEKPWKYDFTSWTQITNAPYVPSLIEEHKGMLFFNDTNDKTRIFFSNFGVYDTYTSTDFIYVPTPKSFDSLTAFAKLNGVLFLLANRNKFQLYGSDDTTFSLDEAASQRGTYSQDSCVYDANFIYHADKDGIWQFDGSSEKNLALPFLSDYQAIPNKQSIRLDLYSNRLYCFYTPAGGDVNSECFVINLLLDVYESLDRYTYVGKTFGRDVQEDDLYLQASNRVAAIYYAEKSTNDYSNLSDKLRFKLKTAYTHFDSPGQSKRIPKWRPQFPSQSGDYPVQIGYDLDYAGTPTSQDVSVKASGPRYNTGVLYNTGQTFGGTRMVTPSTLNIPGAFKRAQRIYSHDAAREPVELDSEVLTVEIQRLT